jgi:cation transporter-like permease
MGIHHKPASSGLSPRATSILFGALIAGAAFLLLLTALGWFVPRFMRFTESPWAKLLPVLTIVFISAIGLIRFLRKR